MPPRLALLILATGASLGAQAFVVDRVGGAGVHFVDIAAAVAAVPDGATLLVRPGTYPGFSVNAKGLTILGDPGAAIDGLVQIANTSALQNVTLRGFGWQRYTATVPPQAPALITLSNCAGLVVLENLDTSNGVACLMDPFSRCSWTPGLSASNCSALVVRGCAIHVAALLSSCSVAIESSVFLGKSFMDNSAGNPTFGASLTYCTAQVAGASRFAGGDGVYGHALAWAAPGLMLWGGSLRFLEGVATGGTTVSYPVGASAIEVRGGADLRLDPTVVLIANGAPPIANLGGSGVLAVMPALTATGAALGGTVSAAVRTEDGDLVIVLVGLPGAPLSVGGFVDAFWLNPAAYVFHAIGVQASGVPVTGVLAVPNNPSLRGFVVAWQAVASGPVTGLQASNPSMTLVR